MSLSNLNIHKLVKSHKFAAVVCTGALVLGFAIGGFGIANAINLKQAQDKVLSQMASNGDLSAEDIHTLADSGMLGEEIVDPNTGETVVLTQNDDGTISKIVVTDANGNSTGASIAENQGSGNSATHTHSWVPHYGSRTVQTGEKYIVEVEAQNAVYERVCVSPAGTYCNTCGACVTGHQAQMEHTNATGHGGTHSQAAKYEDRLVKAAVPEQGHYEPIYATEQYVDYYYCLACGTKQ